MKTCPDCGCRVYKLGCVNCDEAAYVEEQEMLTDLQYPEQSRESATPADAVDPVNRVTTG